MEDLLMVPVALAVMASPLAYSAAQVWVLIRTSGWWRLLGALPILPMAFVLDYTVDSYRLGGNLWPLVLIFSAPAALLWLGIVWVIMRLLRRS